MDPYLVPGILYQYAPKAIGSFGTKPYWDGVVAYGATGMGRYSIEDGSMLLYLGPIKAVLPKAQQQKLNRVLLGASAEDYTFLYGEAMIKFAERAIERTPEKFLIKAV